MSPNDLSKFSAVMNATAEMYGKTLSSAALALWFQSLKDLDLPAIQSALSAHINSADNGQFMPKPADVRKQLSGTTGDAALFAWAKVLKACGEIGAYTTVVFDDPIIMSVVSDMGGWVQLCHSDEDEQPFKEREFTAKYRAYKQRPIAELAFPPKLLGIFDRENLPNGHEEQLPALIGNPDLARQVLQQAKGNALQVTYENGPPKAIEAERAPKQYFLPKHRAHELSTEDRAAVHEAEREIEQRKK